MVWFKRFLKRIYVNPCCVMVAIGFIAGTYFVFLIPPFSGIDEGTHYMRSLALSSGTVVTVPPPAATLKEDPTGTAQFSRGYYLPTLIQPLIRQIDTPSLTAPAVILKLLHEKVDYSQIEYVKDWAYVNIINPVAYIVDASVMYIVRTVGLHPLYGLYMARFVNLVIAYLIILVAIKCMPFGKNIIAIISAFPMVSAQFATVTYDALVIPLAFLYIALILKVVHSEGVVTVKKIGILTIPLLLLVLIKSPYVVFGVLILAIPPSRYSKKIKYLATVMIVALLTVSAAALSSWMFETNDMHLAYNSIPPMQLQHIIRHPFIFFQTLIHTFNAHGMIFYYILVGAFIVAYKVTLPNMVYLVFPFIVYFFLNSTHDQGAVHNKLFMYERILYFLTACVTVLIICVSFYIFFTPLDNNLILGLQSRYFIPVLPLCYLAFYRISKTTKLALSISGMIAIYVAAAIKIGIYLHHLS